MPRLCIKELDAVLGEVPTGSIVLIIGPAEAYPEAIGLDIIKRCGLGKGARVIISLVNSEPDSIISLGNAMGIPLSLETPEVRGFRIEKAPNVISSLRDAGDEAKSLPEEELVYVLIDATSATWDVEPGALVKAMQSFRKSARGRGIALLLVNPETLRDKLVEALLKETADFTIKLGMERTGEGIIRYMELLYSPVKLVPYKRLFYKITETGIEYYNVLNSM
ncbi:MAG: hypothetical protein F7B95_02940 [Desulfurococcales archaeon]|nr:hypothetical protein [Desulfurococcales archaeon]